MRLFPLPFSYLAARAAEFVTEPLSSGGGHTRCGASQALSFWCRRSALTGTVLPLPSLQLSREKADPTRTPCSGRALGKLCPRHGVRTLQDSGLAPLVQAGVCVVALSIGIVKDRKQLLNAHRHAAGFAARDYTEE